jgi:hypothetical protein
MSRRSWCRVRRGVLTALLPGFIACAPPSTVRSARNVPAPVRLVIENDVWLDMNVFLESESGARMRVGTVSGFGTRTFVLRTLPSAGPWFRLVGDPIGSQALRRSEPVSLAAGQTAHWRVGQTAATSSLFVR